ncbi:MAG: hypothetical protein WKG00_05345 [Polyangiaceae bacterium]
MTARATSLPWALLAAAALCGCAGGAPLLHPAHTLRPGTTSFAAGASGQIALRDPSNARDDDERRLHEISVAPGVAPFVSGRLGILGNNEAGLTYTGRAVRLDARHAFDLGGPALSIGLGGSLIFPQRPGRDDDELRLHGGGVDLPILLGVRSRNDLYALWAGPRVGLQLLSGDAAEPFVGDDPNEPTPPARDVDGKHLYTGLVLGMRAGFRHLHVALEIDASYHHAWGSFGDQERAIDQVSITPAGAVVLSF